MLPLRHTTSRLGSSVSTGPALAGPGPTSNVRLLRQHPRQLTALRAILNTAHGFQPTTVRDVSLGGVGLKDACSLLPGDRVELHLLTGHRYPGVVRWWCHGHCGIAFEQMISGDDPLIRQAERRRQTLTESARDV